MWKPWCQAIRSHIAVLFALLIWLQPASAQQIADDKISYCSVKGYSEIASAVLVPDTTTGAFFATATITVTSRVTVTVSAAPPPPNYKSTSRLLLACGAVVLSLVPGLWFHASQRLIGGEDRL
ncbi:hypothetical protein GQ43DRAFT_64794 [Delitschia confertaspora ATCC 74209]|uniref:Uncharacterized protein n=1 Tax=Delitschia confertaspora ATCC 74209 TaxID=1513339 RepID=A0A9P4JM05_9PLEO|nr:hypothetical protein GQ43DRAFT_64794 [Delitschia confertaspora ATCC 74209]